MRVSFKPLQVMFFKPSKAADRKTKEIYLITRESIRGFIFPINSFITYFPGAHSRKSQNTTQLFQRFNISDVHYPTSDDT